MKEVPSKSRSRQTSPMSRNSCYKHQGDILGYLSPGWQDHLFVGSADPELQTHRGRHGQHLARGIQDTRFLVDAETHDGITEGIGHQ